jgi:cysteine synthase
MPGIFDMSFPDERLFLSTESVYDMAKRLAREEGIFVGHSSGSALAAAFTIPRNFEEVTIVVMFRDSGDCYLSREVLPCVFSHKVSLPFISRLWPNIRQNAAVL